LTAYISSPPNGRGLRGGRSKIVASLSRHTENLNAMGIDGYYHDLRCFLDEERTDLSGLVMFSVPVAVKGISLRHSNRPPSEEVYVWERIVSSISAVVVPRRPA
jgi:hypothetical protein